MMWLWPTQEQTKIMIKYNAYSATGHYPLDGTKELMLFLMVWWSCIKSQPVCLDAWISAETVSWPLNGVRVSPSTSFMVESFRCFGSFLRVERRVIQMKLALWLSILVLIAKHAVLWNLTKDCHDYATRGSTTNVIPFRFPQTEKNILDTSAVLWNIILRCLSFKLLL